MTTRREAALGALVQVLIDHFQPLGVEVVRNQDGRRKIPQGGLVILHDGEEVTRESYLGPPHHVITWAAEINVFAQSADSAARDQVLDDILSEMPLALLGQETLGGTVDWARLDGEVGLVLEPVEGGENIKAAIISVYFEYGSDNPIG